MIPSAAPPNALLGLVLETTAHGAEGSLYYLTADGVRRVVVGGHVCPVGAIAAASCADGAVNGEETDVDCGGRQCGRCAAGAACLAASDCASFNCTAGTCGATEVCARRFAARALLPRAHLFSSHCPPRLLYRPAQVYIHTAALLTDYLDSDFYRNSFLHHGIHQVRSPSRTSLAPLPRASPLHLSPPDLSSDLPRTSSASMDHYVHLKPHFPSMAFADVR